MAGSCRKTNDPDWPSVSQCNRSLQQDRLIWQLGPWHGQLVQHTHVTTCFKIFKCQESKTCQNHREHMGTPWCERFTLQLLRYQVWHIDPTSSSKAEVVKACLSKTSHYIISFAGVSQIATTIQFAMQHVLLLKLTKFCEHKPQWTIGTYAECTACTCIYIICI